MPALKKYAPGIFLTIAIAILGKMACGYLPKLGAVTLSIIIGIIAGNLIPWLKPCEAGISFVEKKVLPLAIALLGVELQLEILSGLGLPAIILVIIIVATTILSGALIGKFMGFSRPFSILMGTGNAVCGSSAIAAMSKVVDCEEEDIGISIGVVNLLGTIGIFALPLIVKQLGFAETQSGAAIGGSLQAVGQVVAAGFSMNDHIGNIAVVVKMGRVLMLGPAVILVSYILSKQGTNNDDNDSEAPKKSSVKIPLFIVGFFIFSLLASFSVISEPQAATIKTVGKYLLITAMAGIGLKIRFASLLKQGPKALLFGSCVALLQIVIVLGFIRFVI